MPLPEIRDDWNQGKFILNITRCDHCNLHYHYSRHSEDEFINAFNNLGFELQSLFPNMEVVGNYEKPPYSSVFDVYVRGLGPVEKRDYQGRFYLYRRKERGGRMPTVRDISDQIIILSMLYGDTMKLETA